MCTVLLHGGMSSTVSRRSTGKMGRPSQDNAVRWNSLHADKLAAGHRQAAGFALNNGVVVRACKPLSMLLAQGVFSLRVLVKAEA